MHVNSHTTENNGAVKKQHDNLPVVTILLASYNRLFALKQSIESALKQTYPRFEVLIVDDGSERETCEYLSGLQERERSVRVHFQRNQGPATARANGVEQAKGEFICILDSDDILREHAISHVMTEFESDPSIDLVHVNNRKIFDGEIVGKSDYLEGSDQLTLKRQVLLSPIVPFKHSGMTFRRQTILQLGNYDKSLMRKIDVDIFLRFLRSGKKIKLIEQPPLVDFYQNSGSISRSRMIGIRSWFKIIDRYENRRLNRAIYKGIRAGSELGKMLVEQVRYSKSSIQSKEASETQGR